MENKKKIIITSDMYLNKNYIEDILKNSGIDQYNYLFLSNDVKLNKHNGKIYKYILNKLNIKSNQIIHIGDSKRGDFIFPRIYGIKSILIPKKINNLNYCDNEELAKGEKLDYNILQSFINNNMPSNKDIYFQIGYETLGPLLYGYSTWLIDKLKEENIEKVFFLAREGNLLKKAFDIINKDEIESKYLYVSRRSTRVSLLKNIKKLEDIFNIVKMRRIIDLNSFFINIGLNVKDYENILEKYKCNEKTSIDEIKDIEQLFYDIKEDIIKNAKEEEKYLIAYLKQEDFQGKIAVADVGWMGTMQHSLELIAKENDIETDIIGFYMGQSDKAKKFIDEGMKTETYLFDYKSDQYIQIRAFLNLFESFFLAQHGTTIKYTIKDDRFLPILAEYEYLKEEVKIFENIQEGAIEFIKDYNNFGKLEIEISSDIAWNNFKRLGLNPTMKDIKLFGNISYVETIKVKFANPKKLFYYIMHPKQLYIDFCNCSWKIGFLKQFLKLKLNYFKLYKFLDKMSNINSKK